MAKLEMRNKGTYARYSAVLKRNSRLGRSFNAIERMEGKEVILYWNGDSGMCRLRSADNDWVNDRVEWFIYVDDFRNIKPLSPIEGEEEEDD